MTITSQELNTPQVATASIPPAEGVVDTEYLASIGYANPPPASNSVPVPADPATSVESLQAELAQLKAAMARMQPPQQTPPPVQQPQPTPNSAFGQHAANPVANGTQAQNLPVTSSSWKDRLPPDLLRTHANSVEIIGQVIQAFADANVAPAIKQQADMLDAHARRLTADTEAIFGGVLQATLGEVDEFSRQPNWNAFMQRQVPYTRMTVGDALKEAYMNRDIGAMKQIISEYKAAGGNASTQGRPVGATTAYSNTSVQPHVTTASTIPASTLAKATQRFVSGQINKATYMAVEEAYRKAEQEGRVDFTK